MIISNILRPRTLHRITGEAQTTVDDAEKNIFPYKLLKMTLGMMR